MLATFLSRLCIHRVIPSVCLYRDGVDFSAKLYARKYVKFLVMVSVSMVSVKIRVLICRQNHLATERVKVSSKFKTFFK